MSSRRDFLRQGLALSALAAPLAFAKDGKERAATADAAPADLAPPPDLFDAQSLDLDFWIKPRTLSLVRPQSGEKTRVLYWKDGEIVDAAYQELCHILRDVQGKEAAAMDPKLLETLWGTQAYIARFGIEQPLEVLSGYRTLDTNNRLIEQGIPAARQSLHCKAKAADVRIAKLTSDVLGGLVRSFRQGGVGFYYREGPKGGWIHADTGLQRTWKG
ncbi:DUF882 domain-containing protein [Massilia arenosa]|uniref:Murein endopeptidase K n=1 Tax=Zemynaea arenosa TaxID=2561931 RepID=A0A4Y9SD19_9BURK|nr:DUF882 domain-containing protein [Massilia arenosa]TFW20547.1 DUF882 domain-containing protein [Massilia arenosa]